MNIRNYIAQQARARGLDPNAVLAVASVEGGFGGAVGDQGTSFGPFQLHEGGALPHGRGSRWANSPAGIQYALSEIAKVARGLHGRSAIQNIVTRFERPAAPGAEVEKAFGRYGKVGGGAAALTARPTYAAGGLTAAPDKQALQQQLIAAIGADHPDVGTLVPLIAALKQHPPAAPMVAPQPEVTSEHTSEDARVVASAKKWLGTPYVYGGTGKGGIDCSALLQRVWGDAGVRIARTTYDQWKQGRPVGKGQLRAGDAVFFRGSDPRGNLPGHVGIYIGGGKFIEAPHTGASVRVSKLAGRTDFVGARRYG